MRLISKSRADRRPPSRCGDPGVSCPWPCQRLRPSDHSGVRGRTRAGWARRGHTPTQPSSGGRQTDCLFVGGFSKRPHSSGGVCLFQALLSSCSGRKAKPPGLSGPCGKTGCRRDSSWRGRAGAQGHGVCVAAEHGAGPELACPGPTAGGAALARPCGPRFQEECCALTSLSPRFGDPWFETPLFYSADCTCSLAWRVFLMNFNRSVGFGHETNPRRDAPGSAVPAWANEGRDPAWRCECCWPHSGFLSPRLFRLGVRDQVLLLFHFLRTAARTTARACGRAGPPLPPR